MGKIIRSDRSDEELKDKRGDETTVEPVRLPPMRKFAVQRVNAESGIIETIIVLGHALEPFGYGNALAVIEYKQRGDTAIQTFARIFGHFEDCEELTTDNLKIN